MIRENIIYILSIFVVFVQKYGTYDILNFAASITICLVTVIHFTIDIAERLQKKRLQKNTIKKGNYERTLTPDKAGRFTEVVRTM